MSSAREYLKVAAANLRRAAAAQKTEADEVRNQAVRLHQEAQAKMGDRDKQIKILQLELAGLEDDAQRTIVINRIRTLQSEIEVMDREAETQRQKWEQEARAKEGMVSNLNSMAADIEHQAT